MINEKGITTANPFALKANLFSIFAIVAMLATVFFARAQDARAAYLSMAPLDQYLMEREAEIPLGTAPATAWRRSCPGCTLFTC